MDDLRSAALREKQEKEDGVAGGPDYPKDFGLHYPYRHVQTAAEILERSNWVCWPDGGSWRDQESAWIDDILLYFKLRRRAVYEAEKGIVSSDIARLTISDTGKRYKLSEL